MNSLSLENLYFNDKFDDYLIYLSRKNLLEFDDFKQETFLLILNAQNRTMAECKKIATNLAFRMKYKNIKNDNHLSIDEAITEGFILA